MTIDANIIIGFLNGDQSIIQALTAWRDLGITLFLPTVVEAEVLSFSKMTTDERQHVGRFLEENFISISFDRSMARMSASLRQRIRIKFPDAAIAATALLTHTSLVTRNFRDFQKVQGLRLVQI